MYQVIYIEIDEEVTSIIEKLRNTRTKEVFLSVPSRALILQSIVSLKLLRKEADKLDKTVVIVTNDAKEQRLVEKAGIGIKESLEGMDTEGEVKEAVMPRINEKASEKVMELDKSRIRQTSERIGSPDFYDITEETGPLPDWEKVEMPPGPKRMMVEVSREKKRPEANVASDIPLRKEELVSSEELPALDSRQNALLEDFARKINPALSHPQYVPKKSVAPASHIPVSRKIIRAIVSIVILALIVLALAAVYLFIPKAEVRMVLRSRSFEKELEIQGQTARQSLDAAERVVSLRLVEREEKYFFSYPVSGRGISQGQKARGTVTIYNEYSSESQPLVATTRLVSPDKKIFRLVKGVTVPGMKEVGGQSQPGAIEAEVIADETGESYNIDPAIFKIPGFEGSPKYDKFYAKSSAKMTGGSAAGSGTGTGEGTMVTETDIVSAKSKSETQAKVKIWEDLKGSLEEGELIFPNAAEQTIIESASLSRKGDTASEFQYQVSIRVKALVLDEKDVREVFAHVFGAEADGAEISLDYGAVSGDLSAGTAIIRVHGQFILSQEIDTEVLKREIAGKRVSEIQEIIKNYPQIEEVELNVEPSLLFEKLPQLPSRIEVIVIPPSETKND